MRILVIGGTRFIGKAVAEQCALRGDEVILFNRGTSAVPTGFAHVRGDVAALDSHAAELRALAPDAIVHCIAYSQQDAERAVSAFGGLDCRLVVLGSQDCYAGFHSFQVGTELSDFPIDEQMPLAERHYWKRLGHPSHSSAELYDKNLVTEVLMGATERGDVDATVLRLPMVWGPGDYAFEHRHGDLIWHLIDGRHDLVLGEREQAQIWTFGYIENVAAAIVHSLTTSAVSGKVYNVGETKVRTKRRWADMYAAAAQTEFRYEVVPDPLIDPEATWSGPAFHIIMDNSAFVRDTDFRDPVLLGDGIVQTLEWAREHPDRIGAPPDYAARAAAAERYRSLIAAI